MNGPLERAVQALRDETAVEVDGAITRQRIESGLLQRRSRLRAVRRLATVAAMTFMLGGGALAATGLALRLNEPRPASPEVSKRSRKAGERLPRFTAGRSSPGGETPATATPPTIAPAAPAASSSATDAPVPVVRPARQQAATTGAATSTYAAAHRAHFVDRDFPEALVLWTRYLRLAPAGPLAPEAHFNRAVCLLRLDRLEDAATELEPFARGLWGGYRQHEAQKLLEQAARNSP
jgi:hypothetical protein